jgi:hypothetical protein
MRANAECLFCEVSVNPQDKGHIRVVHGWTKDSAWFRDVSSHPHLAYLWPWKSEMAIPLTSLSNQNMETQPWFGEYVKAIAGMADPNRQRKASAYTITQRRRHDVQCC